MWRKWVFIFDLDVLQSSYTHFAWDAHARQEIETLTPQLTSPKKHVFFFFSLPVTAHFLVRPLKRETEEACTNFLFWQLKCRGVRS